MNTGTYTGVSILALCRSEHICGQIA